MFVSTIYVFDEWRRYRFSKKHITHSVCSKIIEKNGTATAVKDGFQSSEFHGRGNKKWLILINRGAKARGLDAAGNKSQAIIRWAMVFFLICGALTLACCEGDKSESGSSGVYLTGTTTTTTTETYTISGAISGDIAEGVTVTLSGAAASVTTTDTYGTYSFTVEAGTYTVTPSLGGIHSRQPVHRLRFPTRMLTMSTSHAHIHPSLKTRSPSSTTAARQPSSTHWRMTASPSRRRARM